MKFLFLFQSNPIRLVALDSTRAGFARALRRVDACGARAACTVHVFCVRAGRTRAADIVRAGRDQSAPPAFIHMLRG